MKRLAWRLLRSDSGQDATEYALLALLLALGGFLLFQAMPALIGAAYGGYDSGTQDLWRPAPPSGGS